jgi:hypothetical protein
MTDRRSALQDARLRSLTSRFEAAAYCHAPDDRPFDAAALAEPGEEQDRWNRPGEPTAYLSGDAATALAECCRHADPDEFLRRSIVRVELGPLELLDLRRPEVLSALGCDPGESIASDRETARSISARVRRSGVADGLIVASMAFLDQPDRFNVVVYVDRLRDGIDGVVGDPCPVGRVELAG